MVSVFMCYHIIYKYVLQKSFVVYSTMFGGVVSNLIKVFYILCFLLLVLTVLKQKVT